MWIIINAFMKVTIPWIIVAIVFTMLEISFLSFLGFLAILVLLAWSYLYVKLLRKKNGINFKS